MSGQKALFCSLLMQAFLASAIHAQGEPSAAETEFGKSWISAISASSSAEDVLVATMLAQQHEPASVTRLLGMELDSAEHEAMRLSIAWYYCRNNPAAAFCTGQSFADELIALDPANLEPYLYSMLALLEAGRDDAALAALTAGNAATHANTWYLDKQNLVRERLKVAGYPEGRLSLASESLPGALDTYFLYAKLLSVCPGKSAVSIEWKEQCLTLGRKLTLLGNTVVQNIHGLAIQRDTFGGSVEDLASRAQIVEDMAAYNRIRDLANEKLDWVLDPSRKPDQVYADINEFGEIQALERALQRLEE